MILEISFCFWKCATMLFNEFLSNFPILSLAFHDIYKNHSHSSILVLIRSSFDFFSLLQIEKSKQPRFLLSNFSPDFELYSDAKIVLSSGREVPVHRCILSARSQFFKNVFNGKERGAKFELKELVRDYDIGFDSLVSVLGYLYIGQVSVCVDDSMVEMPYGSFVFQVSELVDLYQRQLLDILDNLATDDVLVVLFVANMCYNGCEKLLASCIEIVVTSDVDIVTLDKALPQNVVK